MGGDVIQRHAIALTAAALGLVWLCAIGVILFYVAGLAGVPLLLAAIVAQIAVFLVASAVMLASNVRRPNGIDPNAPPVRERADPFAADTRDLLRPRVQLADGKPYGARMSDDVSVVNRLIDRLEADAAARPAPKESPAWALDLIAESEAAGLHIPTPPDADKLTS